MLTPVPPYHKSEKGDRNSVMPYLISVLAIQTPEFINSGARLLVAFKQAKSALIYINFLRYLFNKAVEKCSYDVKDCSMFSLSVTALCSC
jgi:hypothetical protein